MAPALSTPQNEEVLTLCQKFTLFLIPWLATSQGIDRGNILSSLWIYSSPVGPTRKSQNFPTSQLCSCICGHLIIFASPTPGDRGNWVTEWDRQEVDSKKKPLHQIIISFECGPLHVSYQGFLTWDIYVSFLMVCFIQLILIFAHVHVLGTEKACFEC